MTVEENMERKEYDYNYEDDYYYISEIIQTLNFSIKSRIIKYKCNKPKEEIEKLEKQKKYKLCLWEIYCK